MGEAENYLLCLEHVQERGSPDPDPMHACSGSATGAIHTAKRSVTRERDDPAETINTELDPATRLEKETLASLQEKDIQLAGPVAQRNARAYSPRSHRSCGGTDGGVGHSFFAHNEVVAGSSPVAGRKSGVAQRIEHLLCPPLPRQGYLRRRRRTRFHR